MQVTQTSNSRRLACQSDSATHTASCVLPQDSSQPPGRSPATRAGASTTTVPVTRAAPRSAAVSARAQNPSASEGTTPTRTGHTAPCSAGPDPTAPPSAPTGPPKYY